MFNSTQILQLQMFVINQTFCDIMRIAYMTSRQKTHRKPISCCLQVTRKSDVSDDDPRGDVTRMLRGKWSRGI